MNDSVTALEARHLRLRLGKPLAEVDRLWRLESSDGLHPDAAVPFEDVGKPVDYRDLEQREAVRDAQLELRAGRLREVCDL